MLVGHLWDTWAAWDAQLKQLTVSEKHVRMRSDLEFIMQMNGAVYDKLSAVEADVKLLLGEVQCSGEGAVDRCSLHSSSAA